MNDSIKLIDHSDIMALNISAKDSFLWVEDMLKHKDRSVLPPKTHINLENNVFYNVMPSVLPDQNVMGVKVVTRQPLRTKELPGLTSQILLYQLDIGKPIAVLDSSFITAMRTGAVAAHAISLFARKDFETLGLAGLGITARATMDVYLELYGNKQLKILLLRYKDQAERFANRYQKYKNLTFEIVDTMEEICSSDVVISCVTYQKDPFVSDSCFKRGCTVIPVHTRGFQNCDLFFDKVFADDTGHVVDFQNYSKFKHFAEVSDVVCHRAAGRENDDERILVYNIGLSIHDIYFANKIYQMSAKVAEHPFCQPEEKMWL